MSFKVINLDSNGQVQNILPIPPHIFGDGPALDGYPIKQPDGKLLFFDLWKLRRLNSDLSVDTDFGNNGIVDLKELVHNHLSPQGFNVFAPYMGEAGYHSHYPSLISTLAPSVVFTQDRDLIVLHHFSLAGLNLHPEIKAIYKIFVYRFGYNGSLKNILYEETPYTSTEDYHPSSTIVPTIFLNAISDNEFVLVKYFRGGNKEIHITYITPSGHTTDIFNFQLPTFDTSYLSDVLILPDNKILIALDFTFPSQKIVFYRINYRGGVDTSFGNNGKIEITIPSGYGLLSRASLFRRQDGTIEAFALVGFTEFTQSGVKDYSRIFTIRGIPNAIQTTYLQDMTSPSFYPSLQFLVKPSCNNTLTFFNLTGDLSQRKYELVIKRLV